MGKKQKTRAISEPIPYRVKAQLFTGSRFADITPQTRALMKVIAKHTKRHPYVRSAYFQKDKVFFTYFWKHLNQKPVSEQVRRMKLLPCALELLRESRNKPISKVNADRPTETLHRFAGITKNGILFYVQVKELKRSGRKELMSVFSPH